MSSSKTATRVVALIGVLILFFISLELMGSSFKLMGKGFAESLLKTTSNPFVSLFIGVLATSLVQSSSTVTSMVVSIVAGGGLTVAGAIPIVMGANIGTSVTNTIVSLGHITRKDEFRRAIAGATVHDFFNLMAVGVLFPLELYTGMLTKMSGSMATAVTGVGGASFLSPVKAITKPVAHWIIDLVQSNGILVLAIGVVFLFIALRYLVVLLKALVLGRSEQVLHKYIFGAAPVAMLVGIVITILVQSSSITTSLTVPLVGAGIVTVARIFPFVLGANIGTTITAILAALVLAGDSDTGVLALQVAFAHLAFNAIAVGAVLPVPFLRSIPIRLAEMLGSLAAKNRLYALGYVVGVFFVLPLVVILLTRNVDTSFYGSPDGADVIEQQVEQVDPIESTESGEQESVDQ